MNNDKPLDMLQIKIDQARDALPIETKHAIDSVDWKAIILGMREKKGYSFEQIEDLELETELLLCGLTNPEDYPKNLEKSLQIPRSQVDLLVNEMNEFVFKKIREELIKNTERKEIFTKRIESIEKKSEPTSPQTLEIKKDTNQILTTPEKTPLSNMTTNPKTEEENTNNQTINKNETKVLIENKIEIEAPKENIIPPVDVLHKQETNEIPKTPEVLKIEKVAPPVNKIPESISAQKLVGSFQIPTITTQYSLNKNINSSTSKTNTQTKTSKIDPYRISPEE